MAYYLSTPGLQKDVDEAEEEAIDGKGLPKMQKQGSRRLSEDAFVLHVELLFFWGGRGLSFYLMFERVGSGG